MRKEKAGGKLLKILREQKLYKTGGRWVPPVGSELMLVLVCFIIAILVLMWSSGVEPPDLPQQTTVILVRLDSHNVTCTIYTSSRPLY